MKSYNAMQLALTVAAAGWLTTGAADTVKTSFGNGADVEIREHSNNSANGASMNTRTSSAGDRSELIGLRFDLTGYTLANMANVSLNLTSFRNDTSTRIVNLYGVTPGATAAEGSFTTETWTETGLTTFGAMPGLLATDGNFLTQSLDPAKTTLLGTITVANASEGATQTFSDPALTAFIQAISGSQNVTFLLAAGNNSTGQFRVGSKEATQLTTAGLFTGPAGTFAPSLTFVVPEPSTIAFFTLGGLALLLRRRS